MPSMFLLVVVILTVAAGLLVILQHKKFISVKKNSYNIILHFSLVIGIIYIALSLFGGPLLDKINAYREGVLMESEEQCKGENAPYWCHL